MTTKTLQLTRNVPNDIVVHAPTVTLVKRAVCVSGKVLVGASQTVFTTDIQGYGNDFFVNMKLTVIRDSAGGGAAPEGEEKTITGYVSATGEFTTGSFSVTVDADDRVYVTNKTVAADVTGTCDAAMTPSTTEIVCADLIGAGAHAYNGRYLRIDTNANGSDDAPVGEERSIVDFDTITGTVTTQAFSANVEEYDTFSIITHGFQLDDDEAYAQQFLIKDNKYEVS